MRCSGKPQRHASRTRKRTKRVRCNDELGSRARALRKDCDGNRPQSSHAAPFRLDSRYFMERFGGEVTLAAPRAGKHRNVLDYEKSLAATVAPGNVAK